MSYNGQPQPQLEPAEQRLLLVGKRRRRRFFLFSTVPWRPIVSEYKCRTYLTEFSTSVDISNDRSVLRFPIAEGTLLWQPVMG